LAVDRVPAQPRGARFVCAEVAEFLADRPPADLVVVNPPRRGLSDAVLRALLDDPPRRLFYVSCMPETLARDLARLQSAYSVERVRPYDLLPHTPHVELLVELMRLDRSAG